MKKLLFSLVFTFCILASNAYSQTTMDAIKIKDLDAEYVEIVGHQKGFSTNMKIYLDYGKVGKAFQ